MFKSDLEGALRLKLAAGVSLAALAVFGSGQAFALDASDTIETVTVTGYRASLEKALDMKRADLGATDSIMAEDVAKFPDMNVSEALQRIPGVALSREAGEGRQITVRGLGAQFTRVRINGMEALATTQASGGGTNRGRSFDFNVFASELFKQLTVRKSMSANVQEGSLGATVDLQTAHPFDYSGFVFTTSAQMGYQAQAKAGLPRVSVLASNSFLGGRLGVLFSGAYAIQNVLEEGVSTTRWYNDGTASGTAGSASNRFLSVNGLTSGADYTTANAAFHPRFPTYAIANTREKRLGMTSSVQWQPDEDTLFTLDGLFADFAQIRDEAAVEANAFSVSGSGSTYAYTDTATASPHSATIMAMHNIGLVNFHTSDVDGQNSLIRAQARNVNLRSESATNTFDTRFMQLTFTGQHSFSQAFQVHTLFGWSESHHRNPGVRWTADYGCTNTTGSAGCTTGGAGTAEKPYSYDFSQGPWPYISYGNVDVTSTDGWFLSQTRIEVSKNYNSFRTAAGDFSYTISDWAKIEGGIDYRNYGYHTVDYRRSNGTTSSLDTSIPDAIRSKPLSDYAKIVNFRGVEVPDGTATQWWVIDLKKANGLFNYWDQTVYSAPGGGNCASGCGTFHLGTEPNVSANGGVRENDLGSWVQFNWETQFYGVPFRGNVGVRYVVTDSTSSGFIYNLATKLADPTQASQTYHDWLPSLNAVFSPTETFLIRLNGSYAMSRPDLTNMLPGGSVSATGGGSNRTVSITNPLLKPIRSKNLDLAFEWYYHKGSMISLAGFYKHIDSTIQTISGDIAYVGNPYGLSSALAIAACGSSYGSACNENLLWSFSMPRNEKGGPLYGMEINWQQQLDFLPGALSNVGFMVNATLVQAVQNYYNSDGTIRITGDLEGMSRTSYNTTVYYDDQIFQARLTAAFRSRYAASMALKNLNNGLFQDSSLFLDASSSYKVNDNFMLTFDAMNLTDDASSSYADRYAHRLNGISKDGRTYYIGVKYSY